MRLLILLTLAFPIAAFAQPYLPGRGVAPDAAPVPKAAQQSPQRKLAQYRHDQVNLLALRADAPSLIAAALLAQADATDSARPAVLKTPALIKRAQRLDPNNPLVWWVSAGVECVAAKRACPNVDTLRKLQQLDAGNAAVWALSMWRARRDGDAPIERAALTSAAQAKQYNDYFGAMVAALYRAQGILPMSSNLLLATGEQANVEGYRLTNAAGIALAVLPPANKAIVEVCKSADEHLRADCVAIADKMSISGSLNTRRDGLDLLEALLQHGAQKDTARARARELAWQTQQIGQLGTKLSNNRRVTTVYVRALQANGDESAAVAAVLRSQGLTLRPPPGWKAPKAAN